MRIIAGQYRSRPLRTLRGTKMRPTSDHLRETLFNVLTAGRPAVPEPAEGPTPNPAGILPFAETVWLDVFAGTGAVGLEALSRGARSVYFIESAHPAAVLIRENLRWLGIASGYEVIERSAVQALRLLDSEAVACDFCFSIRRTGTPAPMRRRWDSSLSRGYCSPPVLWWRSTINVLIRARVLGPWSGIGHCPKAIPALASTVWRKTMGLRQSA